MEQSQDTPSPTLARVLCEVECVTVGRVGRFWFTVVRKKLQTDYGGLTAELQKGPVEETFLMVQPLWQRRRAEDAAGELRPGNVKSYVSEEKG